MEEDDVDSRKTAQTRQCIQPFWFGNLHSLLDAPVNRSVQMRKPELRPATAP
jgi:hypothetical protein